MKEEVKHPSRYNQGGILVYVWSLHGGGKLCPKCKSKFTSIGCMRNTLWNGGRK